MKLNGVLSVGIVCARRQFVNLCEEACHSGPASGRCHRLVVCESVGARFKIDHEGGPVARAVVRGRFPLVPAGAVRKY